MCEHDTHTHGHTDTQIDTHSIARQKSAELIERLKLAREEKSTTSESNLFQISVK